MTETGLELIERLSYENATLRSALQMARDELAYWGAKDNQLKQIDDALQSPNEGEAK